MGSGKIKIFVLGRDKIGWSIDKDREAVIRFLKLNNFEIVQNVLNSTHIFCVWYDLLYNLRYRGILYLAKFLDKKIIAVITNDITNTPEKVEFLRRHVNICISPSTKVLEFLKREKIKALRIPFFIDPEIFKPLNQPKKEICENLGIDWDRLKNKIVIGSFQRDPLGRDLSKPKWQKNPDLLIHILKKITSRKIHSSLSRTPEALYCKKMPSGEDRLSLLWGVLLY